MKTAYAAIAFLAFPLFLFAQSFQDNFTDGEFLTAPPWQGDVERFTALEQVLQLNDTAAVQSTAYLSTLAPTSLDTTTTWNVFIRQSFSPSSSNFAVVYLGADNPDLTAAGRGYFLRFGGTSGDIDSLELYRQDPGGATKILGGTAGSLGQDPAVARVQVQRTPGGIWTVEADYTGGANFTFEGTALDSTYSLLNYFGWVCRYTSTRSTNFEMDDVLIRPLFRDRQAPRLVSAFPRNPLTIDVAFDEALEETAALEPANYTIDNGIGNPMDALFTGPANDTVRLVLSQPLVDGQSYLLTASGIADRNDNTADPLTTTFIFRDIVPAAPGDIQLTEIMADPSPVVADLPETEYVELLNVSEKTLNLASFQLVSGSTSEPLEDYLLLAGDYVVLCPLAFRDSFPVGVPVLGVDDFPALSNAADNIELFNAEGESIAALTYEDDWYRDSDRNDGGYALEIIDPNRSNACAGNWHASLSDRGGTPGGPNAVTGDLLDQEPPFITELRILNASELALDLSEPIDSASGTSTALYTLSGGIGVLNARPQLPGFEEIRLQLNPGLNGGQRFQLRVEPGLRDCLGNTAPEVQVFDFGLPEPAQAGDVLINEILFNPESGGSDFLELLNVSEKIINLGGWEIRNRFKESGDTIGTVENNYLLFPGELVVITESPQDILDRYTVPRPEVLLENDLPTFDDDEGNITLLSNDSLEIDIFDYLDDYHLAVLDDDEGVSLERISPDAPTQSPGNWHSAAESAGFATPSGENSQFFPINQEVDNVFRIEETTFSPDGDGFQDVLLIQYQTDQPGYVANINAYDANGRMVRRIARNELLANAGIIKWDGTIDEGDTGRIGIYIIRIELFLTDGTVEEMKKPVVLAGRL